MVTLVPETYLFDDWDKISAIYKDYTTQHSDRITCLEEWIDREPHLPKLSKPSLGLFLKMSNDSTEIAKEKIDEYFTHKTRHPEMFTNRLTNMKKVEQTLDLFEVGMPEHWEKSHEGNRLVFFRIVDTDVTNLDFRQATKILTAVLDFELARVGLLINGITAVVDFTGFHMGFIPKLTVSEVAAVMKYANIIENMVSSLHVLNSNVLINQVMALVRPFLSKTLSNKILLYTENEINEFFKVVPKSCVSSTYGGDLPTMTEMNAVFRKRLQRAEDWLKNVDSGEFQVKENLRRVQAGKEDMKGSFRRLAID